MAYWKKDMKQLIESLFDKDLVTKNFSPEEIADFYKGYKYNEKTGKKDCLGNPLKEGDVVLVCEDPFGHKSMWIGVYKGSNGVLCNILAPAVDRLVHVEIVRCRSVVKIDPKIIK